MAAGALALTAVGCGQSAQDKDRADARATVDAYGKAVQAKDYRALCDRLLAPQLISGLGAVPGPTCPDALAQGLGVLVPPTLTVEKVTLAAGGRAAVLVKTTAAGQPPSTDQIELTKTGPGWRISTLAAPPGSAPGGGAPGGSD